MRATLGIAGFSYPLVLSYGLECIWSVILISISFNDMGDCRLDRLTCWFLEDKLFISGPNLSSAPMARPL
jgi:hypothetical protein